MNPEDLQPGQIYKWIDIYSVTCGAAPVMCEHNRYILIKAPCYRGAASVDGHRDFIVTYDIVELDWQGQVPEEGVWRNVTCDLSGFSVHPVPELVTGPEATTAMLRFFL